MKAKKNVMLRLPLALTLVAALAGACAGSGDDPSSSEVKAPPQAQLGPFAQQALKRCLEKWGSHPFSAQQLQSVRRLTAVTVGGQGVAINDTTTTSGPDLVLIDATVNVLGSATYRLLNPNGWYCLQTGVSVLAQTKVELACNARLADNKVNVNVGSTGGPVGAVGVSVHSSTTVQKVGCGQ